MGSIADAFGSDYKQQYTERSLKVGVIIKRFENSTNPPKTKYSIIVGESNDNIVFARVYINSEINPNLFPTPDLMSLHHGLDDNDYNCLERYSYVDCSRLINISKEELIEEISSATDVIQEDVKDYDLTGILEIIKIAGTINRAEKRRFDLL